MILTENTNMYNGYINAMKSKLYGLLCEREKKGEWKKFLETIEVELLGFPEELKSINYFRLCTKVSSLKFLSYDYFRKTIFECMNLFDKIDV